MLLFVLMGHRSRLDDIRPEWWGFIEMQTSLAPPPGLHCELRIAPSCLQFASILLFLCFPNWAVSCRLQTAGSHCGAGPDISTGCAADTQSRDRGLVTTGSQSYHANISFLGNSVFNPIMNDAWLEASDEGVLPSFVWWLVSDNTGCLPLSPGRVHVSLCGPARVICIHQPVNWLRHSWHRDADRERRF